MRGEEIDRFELALGDHVGTRYTGHLRAGGGLAPLPIGSQLDATTGQFTWAPGVGFVGTYDLVFVRWEGTQAVARHEVRIILAPKGRGHVGVQVAIDTPRSQQDVGQPFVLAGWAADLDAAEGSGIDTLHVWAYPSTGGAPVFLGTPTLGGIRPDVAAVYGDQFREAGFALPGHRTDAGHLRFGRIPVESCDRRIRAAEARARDRAVGHAWCGGTLSDEVGRFRQWTRPELAQRISESRNHFGNREELASGD